MNLTTVEPDKSVIYNEQNLENSHSLKTYTYENLYAVFVIYIRFPIEHLK